MEQVITRIRLHSQEEMKDGSKAGTADMIWYVKTSDTARAHRMRMGSAAMATPVSDWLSFPHHVSSFHSERVNRPNIALLLYTRRSDLEPN